MAAAGKAAIDFIEVESSNVHSWKYDSGRKVVTVRFHNGSAYEYPDVTQKEWDEYRNAKSAGKIVAVQLRMKSYNRIDDWK